MLRTVYCELAALLSIVGLRTCRRKIYGVIFSWSASSLSSSLYISLTSLPPPVFRLFGILLRLSNAGDQQDPLTFRSETLQERLFFKNTPLLPASSACHLTPASARGAMQASIRVSGRPLSHRGYKPRTVTMICRSGFMSDATANG
jgi:hypothetical protein